MLLTISRNGHFKASVINRVIAKVIDILIVFLITWVLPYPVGPLGGFFLSLCADGLSFGPFRGQSIGKKILGLQVYNTAEKHPAHLRDSMIRNTPVGVATFFAIIPIWGWLILGIVGIPLVMMEIYLMVTVESGHRLGDVMADTEVIELKKANLANSLLHSTAKKL